MTTRHRERERGAAAVEFALILIPLLVLLLGIIEFGYIFNQQLTVTNAAREGARVLAITKDSAQAISAAGSAASSLNGTPAISIVAVCPTDGSAGDAKVSLTIPMTTITGIEGIVPGFPEITLSATGVTPCGG